MNKYATAHLRDIASVQTGPFGSQLHQRDYVNIGTPIITVEHLGDNKILHENLPRISNRDRDRLSKYQLLEGDIVFSRVGSVDRCAYVKKEEEGWLFSGRCLRIRADPRLINPRYLSFYFGHPSFKTHIRQIAVGATMPSLNTSLMSKLEIPLPPLPIQKKIASILSSLDDKIEINIRMNKVIEEIARALFHRWFVEFEFPDAEGRPYKSAGGKMGEDKMASVPEGWKVTSLDQIAEYMNGIACQKYPPSEDEDSMAVIKIRELRSGNLSEADRVSPSVPEKYHIQNGDVLFSWSGSLMVDIWCSGEGILNQHLFKVSSDTYPKWFYYLWTKHHLQEFQMIAVDKTTTMGHIKRHHLTDAKVVVPSKDVLEIMNGVMSPLISQIIRYNLEINALTELRDSLLPKLISGELPVPIPSPNNAETGGAD